MPVTSVRLKDDISRELELTAKREQRSRNWIVNEALRQYLFAQSPAVVTPVATAVSEQVRKIEKTEAVQTVEHIEKVEKVRADTTIAPAASAPASVVVKNVSSTRKVEDTSQPRDDSHAAQPWKGVVSWFKHIASDDAESGANSDAKDVRRQSPTLKIFEE